MKGNQEVSENFHHESILPAVPRRYNAEACRTLHMANKAGAEETEDSFR